ncbi:unnamed protein product [Protopolystoma xenopodis]|uniref:Uncharacterized protein n=1 Tax=Protopolystoma xenopodis TaxID=117903 RepID=A0A3S5AEH7_9PLAT|nr:unnamed protein product [Protopolystoma xenopodis]
MAAQCPLGSQINTRQSGHKDRTIWCSGHKLSRACIPTHVTFVARRSNQREEEKYKKLSGLRLSIYKLTQGKSK